MILYTDNLPDQFLYAELRRDMALDHIAFNRFMRWMLLISLSIGMLFYLAGAWPIVGFLGADVLLIWGGFKLYARSYDRQFDKVTLEKDALVIEQHRGGRCCRIEYEPSYLQMSANSDNNSSPIRICQRGNCCDIGLWLGPEEREAFVKMLKDALKQRQQMLVSGQ